jgi:hypothetical protein
MVLKFDPPELQDQLLAAIETWKQKIDITREDDFWDDLDDFSDDTVVNFSDDIVDVTDAGFNAADYPDQTITCESEFHLGLPEWEGTARVTYGEFIELARELSSAELIENRECLTEHRYLLRVAPANDQTVSYLWQTLPEPNSDVVARLQEKYVKRSREADALFAKLREMDDASSDGEDQQLDKDLLDAWRDASSRRNELSEKIRSRAPRYCSLRVSLDSEDATCALTEGFTVFGAAVAAAGDYSKDFQPVGDDLFVEVHYQRPVALDTARYVADAYLFELSSSLGLEFKKDPRPTLEELEWYPEGEPRIPNARLRPLLLGKGMPDLLRLYNRAVAASDDETRILYFTKVVEYVSQTVVKQQATEAIRAKLLSPRSLSPDAAFVAELQAVVEEQRVLFRKDREALRQTVIICCEASEVSKVAPPFLSKLRDFSHSDKPKDKEDALAELGYSLSATRNSVAHAKANYEPTGEECPQKQLAAFAECAKVAAQQTVRWYHSRPEDTRIL